MLRWTMKHCATAILLASLATANASPAPAQEQPPQTRFMAACDEAIQRNNPIYTAQQRQTICTCRYQRVSGALSEAELETMIALMGGRESDLLQTPDRIGRISVESFEACIPY